MRKTLDRKTVVTTANRMIAHLAESGTKSDADKRQAIIAVTSQILLDGNSYAGFSYLGEPRLVLRSAKDGLVPEYDDTRVAFL